MWDLIVLIPDHCLFSYYQFNRVSYFCLFNIFLAPKESYFSERTGFSFCKFLIAAKFFNIATERHVRYKNA